MKIKFNSDDNLPLNKILKLHMMVCDDLSMIVYDLDDFKILNIKVVDYRCFVCNKSRNTAIKLLNNSKLHDKVIL